MPEELFFAETPRVLRVTELTRTIRQLLESQVPLLWVRGEISNFVRAASGHCYFSLKDEQSQVRCVMFRNRGQAADERIGNGVQVEVRALATLYEARGDFQLTVEQMRPAGLGQLYEQFVRLKQQLEREGLFDAARKRPLPAFPKRIGIITSPQAAALRDVLATLRQRLPGVPLVLYPAPVQGAGSGEKIAQAISVASQRGECEVLIVCRGGGSLEDLWAFNEEVVARAVAASRIPVVSGVGHETDFTICDFAADERAPTPTAAAQRVAPDRLALLRGLRDLAQHLQRAQRNRLHGALQALDYLQRRLVHPQLQLQRQGQQLALLQQRLQRGYSQHWQRQHWRLQSASMRLGGAGGELARLRERHAHLAGRLMQAMQTRQDRHAMRVDNAARQLALLDPKQVLGRGYSLVQDGQGGVVTDAGQLPAGAALRITFAQGWADASVLRSSGRQAVE